MYIHYRNNPCGIYTGDCVIRAISIVTGQTWQRVYAGLCLQGYQDCGWGNFNSVWADYLKSKGFSRYMTDQQTVSEFAARHPHGRYVLGTGSHAVAVIDGDYIDSWDSGGEIVKYYFTKE